jgi:hypothetical protein
MHRLLIALATSLVAGPVMAQVEPKIHKLCTEAKDYAGCVKTMENRSDKESQGDLLNSDQQLKIGNYIGLVICEFGEDGMARMDANDAMRYFQNATSLDPSLYKAIESDPKATSQTRGIAIEFISQRCPEKLPPDPAQFKPVLVPTVGCPLGTAKYTVDQPTGFLGLGKPKKVDIGCMTPAEASAFHQQRSQAWRNVNTQQQINQMQYQQQQQQFQQQQQQYRTNQQLYYMQQQMNKPRYGF